MLAHLKIHRLCIFVPQVPVILYYICARKPPKAYFADKWKHETGWTDIVHWTRKKGETETEGQSWLQVKWETDGLLWCGGSPASTLSLFNIHILYIIYGWWYHRNPNTNTEVVSWAILCPSLAYNAARDFANQLLLKLKLVPTVRGPICLYGVASRDTSTALSQNCKFFIITSVAPGKVLIGFG